MIPERLNILLVAPMPPSPPRFGAQARMHGLMTSLAARNDVTAITLVDRGFDAEACERAMRRYCRDVRLIRNPRARTGLGRRLLQLRSLASRHTFERLLCAVPALEAEVGRALERERFDVVHLEFPYQAQLPLRRAPPGSPPPALVLNTHDIAWDLARQMAGRASTWGRRAYAGIAWRKLRREELAAFASADGICTCSAADERRLLHDLPGARTSVIPNAADVDYFQPRPGDPRPDGRTVLFFGLLSTVPNVDGLRFLVDEVWPRVAAARPDARCRILGADAPRAVRALAGPGVELVGPVEDLRPHLASASALVVPLRLGSGTRLKILEGLAMARPIVSTSLGAEGIDAVPDRDLLVADDPARFAAAVVRLLDDPSLGERLGRSGRRLVVERYSWTASGRALERFYREILSRPAAERRTA